MKKKDVDKQKRLTIVRASLCDAGIVDVDGGTDAAADAVLRVDEQARHLGDARLDQAVQFALHVADGVAVREQILRDNRRQVWFPPKPHNSARVARCKR